MRRPLVEPCVVPTGPLLDQEEWQWKNRLAYIQEGLDRNYPLRKDPHDRRIFKVTTPLRNFLPIPLGCMSLAEWQEETKPRSYGDIRYKPAGEYAPKVEVLEAAEEPGASAIYRGFCGC